MGFLVHLPLGAKHPRTLRTTNTLVSQLWQELVMLRHLKIPASHGAPGEVAPWIDQGRTYFFDASRSNWRSAGLLYYYSFLNLAKAYLIWKNRFTAAALSASPIYHGLNAESQRPAELIDFEFKIYPPNHGGRKNVFSTLYEEMTEKTWPFNTEVSVKLSWIASRCSDIASELDSLYNLEHKIIYIQSLMCPPKEKKEPWGLAPTDRS